eukprot:jgi/Phyca11/14740/fgenesh1_pg.PHYCAscaffold_9_\
MEFLPQDIRDVLMDHLLGSIQTDLKYTVLFICEDVKDFRPQEEQKSTSSENEEAAASDKNAATDTAVSAKDVPLLESLECDYQFRSRLSDGDSIPRCDATLLKIPVSKHDIEREKHAAKKAIKKKIKKFKKSSGETSKPSAEFYVLSPEELNWGDAIS